jgi:hypothetical protein
VISVAAHTNASALTVPLYYNGTIDAVQENAPRDPRIGFLVTPPEPRPGPSPTEI